MSDKSSQNTVLSSLQAKDVVSKSVISGCSSMLNPQKLLQNQDFMSALHTMIKGSLSDLLPAKTRSRGSAPPANNSHAWGEHSKMDVESTCHS